MKGRPSTAAPTILAFSTGGVNYPGFFRGGTGHLVFFRNN